MTAELMDPVTIYLKHLGDEKPEFPVAQNRDDAAAGNPGLIENLAGGCHRLGKDGNFGRDRIGDDMQVDLGQGQKFAECTGMTNDA